MSIKINWKAARGEHILSSFFADVFMVWLVIINLAFIAFDWHWSIDIFRNLWERWLPGFYTFYNTKIHPNFYLYDLIFVGIFITELLIRWAIAIKQKTHFKWFFYPFIHWYDVLGCIPLGTFRLFRFLRVISMTFRLHKLRVIDLRNTAVYKFGLRYYKVLVEEVSDRVVVNVLTGAQREVQQGGPVTERMVTEVIRPHQDTLTEWLAGRIRRATQSNYAVYKEDIKAYLERVIAESVRKNKEVSNLRLIPIIGEQVSKALEGSVSDISYNVVNGLIEDLASEKNTRFIDELSDIILATILTQDEDEKLAQVTKEVFMQGIDLIIEQVKVQQWKLEETQDGLS